MATTCPRCTKPVVEISMIIDNTPVVMRNCSPCGLRWWKSDDTLLDVTDVLDLVASQTSAKSAAPRH